MLDVHPLCFSWDLFADFCNATQQNKQKMAFCFNAPRDYLPLHFFETPGSTVKHSLPSASVPTFVPSCTTRYSRKKLIRCSEGGWLIDTGGGKRSSWGWRSGAFLLSSPLSRRPKTRLPSSRQGRGPYRGVRTLWVLVVSLPISVCSSPTGL